MRKRKIFFYGIVFLVPILLFLLIATITNHVPFGKYLFNIYDSYSMYPSLLVETIRGLKEGNFFFTFFAGLGIDFYNIKTLYMNSPLNLLFLFCEENSVFDFYTFLMCFRVGLSSLTMAVLLNYLDKNKGYGYKQGIFSFIYAFTAYAMACSIHIMWMDAYVLLPIVVMGIEKILNDENCSFYIFILALLIIINFYIGYMVCIFLLLYFIYRTLVLDKFKLKYLKRFILSSLLSALISSFVLIPEILSLIGGRGNAFSLEDLKGIDIVSLVSTVYNLFPTSYLISDNMYGSFIVYFSLFAFVLNIYFYLNNKITKKVKLLTLEFTLFFFISSFVNVIDYTWNMFQKPVWWQHRYSFVVSFFLLLVAYRSYDDFLEINFSKKAKSIICVVVFILLIVSSSLKLHFLLSEFPFYFYIYIFIGFFIFFLYVFGLGKRKFIKIVGLLVIFELSLNCYQTFNILKTTDSQNYKLYLENFSKYDELEEYDDSFYRVIDVDDKNDDSLLFGYNSVSLFSSSYNNRIIDFLDKVGVYEKTVNYYDVDFNNPAILSLLNVKYVVGESEYYNNVYEDIYENKDVLSLGFAVSDNLKELKLSNDFSSNIENIYASLVGYNTKLFYDVDLISDLEYENIKIDENGRIWPINIENDSNINYSFEVTLDGILVPYNSSNLSYITIYLNDRVYKFDEEFDGIIKVKKGDIVKVQYLFEGTVLYLDDVFINDNNLFFKIYDDTKFKYIIEKIQLNDKLDNILVGNNGFKATINCSKDESLFLSIPYDDSFLVYVDGELTKYYDILDTFIGFDLKEGEHTIKIKYIPKGFVLGCSISFLAVILFGFITFFEKRKSNKLA